MKRTWTGFLFLIMAAGFSRAWAVSEAACLFLTISPSPAANGMGTSYGAAAVTSPLAAIMNPAALGRFSLDNYFGYEYYPESSAWLPGFTDEMDYNARLTAFGINLHALAGFPLAIGIAQHKVRLDLGTQAITDEGSPEPLGYYQSFEQSEGTTLALAAEYYLRCSLGVTWKGIESDLSGFSTGGKIQKARATLDARDWGVLVQIPLVGIVRKIGLLESESLSALNFWVDPGFYYSKTNIGGMVSYIDEAQSDPLPRTLSLGLNLQAGLSYHGLTVAGFGWSREVDDMLLERFMDGTSRYLSTPPDLGFWENVVLGKANDRTISKRGYEINLADCYFIRNGRYEDAGEGVFNETSGYGINYLQPLRIAAVLLDLDNSRIGRLLSRIAFEKHHAEYKSGGGNFIAGSQYDSYIFRLNGFSL
jgi:hypothetical protein